MTSNRAPRIAATSVSVGILVAAGLGTGLLAADFHSEDAARSSVDDTASDDAIQTDTGSPGPTIVYRDGDHDDHESDDDDDDGYVATPRQIRPAPPAGSNQGTQPQAPSTSQAS